MKSVKIVVRVATYLLVLLVGVAYGQFKQGIIDHVEVRDHLINEWSKGNQDREKLALIFKNDCVSHGPVPASEIPKEFITIEECSKSNGTQEIVTMLDENQILNTVAWPLSILN